MEAGMASALSPWLQLYSSLADYEKISQEVEEKQAYSLTAKKRLADDTKNFKRLSEAERLSGMPELLKAYQAEIDSLAKRAKFAEAGFGELFGRLREAPDPSGMQALVASKAVDSGRLEEQLKQKDTQVAKLTEAVRDLEAELLQVTNQAVTVRRLQNQIKELEASSDAGTAEVRRQKDEEWGRKLEEMRQELLAQRGQHKEELSQMARQRELCEEDLERLRQQRLEEQRLAEQAVVARAMEVDALSSDLERAQAELEHERLKRTEQKDTQGVQVLQSLLHGVQQRVADMECETAELRRQLSEAEGQAQRRQH